MKHILFDLDGTLLPMRIEEFSAAYLGSLAERFTKYGISQTKFTESMWQGMRAMLKNNGEKTNETAFRERFERLIDIDYNTVQNEFADYYSTDFNSIIKATYPSEYARKIIDVCHAKGFDVILATNPLFPRIATVSRLKWAGLSEDDFIYITTYENSCYCKPNLTYYEDILQKFGYKAEDCLMAGNDALEDMIIGKLGVETYLVEGYIENEHNLAGTVDHRGNLKDLYEFLRDSVV